MKHRGSQPRAGVQAELARTGKALSRGREMLGPRACAAQVAEWACADDAAELAELFAARLAGARS